MTLSFIQITAFLWILSGCYQHLISDFFGGIQRKVMEDMRNEAAKEAARKNSIETAKSLLLLGKLTYAEIAQATKLTVDEVEELDKKKSA